MCRLTSTYLQKNHWLGLGLFIDDLDDFSGATSSAEALHDDEDVDVTETLKMALTRPGCGQMNVVQ